MHESVNKFSFHEKHIYVWVNISLTQRPNDWANAEQIIWLVSFDVNFWIEWVNGKESGNHVMVTIWLVILTGLTWKVYLSSTYLIVHS